MSDDVPIDIVSVIRFAESIAQVYAERGGNVVDLFAAFAGNVVAQDKSIGLAALQATDRWVSKIQSSPRAMLNIHIDLLFDVDFFSEQESNVRSPAGAEPARATCHNAPDQGAS